jgi:hypothetical protein
MSAQITAAHVALAVVAACRMTGADPQAVFGPAHGNKRARLIAAAGLMTALKLKPRDVAGVFKVDRSRLAPSMLRNADIETDHLLTVAEALRTGGVLDGARPQPKAADADASARKPSPVQTRPDRPVAPPPPPTPSPAAPVQPPEAHRPRPAATNPVRARPTPARSGAVETLKAVSDNMVRWSRIYLSRGVPIGDLADLFDVDVEALADRLKPELARAA